MMQHGRPSKQIVRFSLGSITVALGMLMLSPPPSHAQTIGMCDPDGTGRCEKSVNLSLNNLLISLTNDPSSQSNITADAFNLGGNVSVLNFSQISGGSSFGLAPSSPRSGGSIDVFPFGVRQFTISISPNGPEPWFGGGNPNFGLLPGQSATFLLTLGGDLSSLTEGDILTSQVIRFRGGLDSDKDPVDPGSE